MFGSGWLEAIEMDGPPKEEPREWTLDVHLTVGMPLGISVVQNTGIITAVHAAGIGRAEFGGGS